MSRARPVLRAAAQLARRLVREEQGQSLVFGALSIFAVACFATMIANTGMVATRQVAVQNAADAAAYSGALVEANSIEAIAYIGDQMAIMYYQMMRYAVDLTVLDTLLGFQDCDTYPALRPYKSIFYRGTTADMQLPDSSRLAGGEDGPSFTELKELRDGRDGKPGVVQRYREWIGPLPRDGGGEEGKGKRWLKRLARLQRQIAAATPGLVRKAVFETAKAGGAKEVAIFPLPEGRWEEGWMVFNARPRESSGAGVAVFEPATPVDFGYVNATYRRGDDELPHSYSGDEGQNWYMPGQRPGAEGMGASWEPRAYRQTRVCWHKRDLRHQRPDKHGAAPNYERFDQEGPNGHWHHQHWHILKDNFSGDESPAMHGPDDGGSSFLGLGAIFGFDGNDDDGHRGSLDPANHDSHFPWWVRMWASWKHENEEAEDHHGVTPCDLCVGADVSGGGHSQVTVLPFTERPRNHNYDALNTNYVADGDPSMGGELPLPLKLTTEGLRQPINVGIWRDGDTPIVGAVFAGDWPSWGHFAFSSAQVGPVEGPEVQVTSARLDALAGHPYENLFTAQRWGARLVSLKHFKNPLRGGALLDGFANSARWWTVDSSYLSPLDGSKAQELLKAVRSGDREALEWKKLDAEILH